jgi:LPPG:FO 2-phospho-L-lactate transferase
VEPILSLNLNLKRPERSEAESKDAHSSTPLRSAQSASAPVVAVSPIVGGQAIKGPAAKMFRELGWEPSALAVAQHYHGFVTHFVLDQLDADQENAIQSLGMKTLVTNTIMQAVDDRKQLASEVLNFIQNELPE